MTDLDQVQNLWQTVAELQLAIRPTATGHIRTAINVLLEHLRKKEMALCERDGVALALLFPDRWERDWLKQIEF